MRDVQGKYEQTEKLDPVDLLRYKNRTDSMLRFEVSLRGFEEQWR